MRRENHPLIFVSYKTHFMDIKVQFLIIIVEYFKISCHNIRSEFIKIPIFIAKLDFLKIK
jgi:hypothetical protein